MCLVDLLTITLQRNVRSRKVKRTLRVWALVCFYIDTTNEYALDKTGNQKLDVYEDKTADVERHATISKDDGSAVTLTGVKSPEAAMLLGDTPSAEPQEITHASASGPYRYR